MGQIVVFTKTECPHCVAAKGLLSQLDIDYKEIDIEENIYNSALMTHVSNRASVPQIFFNNAHIGGNSELNALGKDKLRELAHSAVSETNDPDFIVKPLDDKQVQQAKMPLRSILEPAIPANAKELPEYLPVKLFYGNFFDSLPITYDYMAIKPDALVLWVPALVESMRLTSSTSIAPEFFGSLALAFAMPSGCDYCTSHSQERIEFQGSEAHIEAINALRSHIEGKLELDALPHTEKEKALLNICIKATVGTLANDDFERLAKEVGADQLIDVCQSLGGMAIIMGFLNRWHDTIGLDSQDHHIENEETRGADLGELKIPVGDGPPDIPAIMQQAGEQIFAHIQPWIGKYAGLPDSQLPNWIAVLPSPVLQKLLASLYHCIFSDDELAAEVKHLCAYAMARDTGFEQIANEELRILNERCADNNQLDQRIDLINEHYNKGSFDVLNEDNEDLSLSLQLARCAQAMPVYVLGSLTQKLKEKMTAEQVTELVLCFSFIGQAQRWLSIYEPLNRYISERC